MLVKDFYNNVGPLFVQQAILNELLPDSTDYEILNYFFVDKFATCNLPFDETTDTLQGMQTATMVAILKRFDYYKAIKQSIATTYNPVLESINLTVETNRNLNETKTKTGTDTVTHGGTETTQNGGTTQLNNTTTNEDASTLTNTNNTFDNAAYRESDQTTTNANGTVTASGTTTTNNNNTLTRDTNDATEYNTEDVTEHTDNVTTTTKGHNQLNYAEVLKQMYDAKAINLYDVIIHDVADVLCEMVYYF